MTLLAVALVGLGASTTTPGLGAEALSVLCPGLQADAVPPSLSKLLGDGAQLLATAEITSAALSRADVVLLTPASVAWIEQASDDTLDTIAAAVASGKGCVIWGSAAGARPNSRSYSGLVARSTPLPEVQVTPPATSLVVLVRDQSHAITQCVNHLVMENSILTTVTPATPGRDVLAYATTRTPPTPEKVSSLQPALWTSRSGRGRVVVWCCEVAPNTRASREEAAVNLLIARAMEWAGGRQITVKIPKEMPLLAERMDIKDEAKLASFPEAIGYFRGREIAPVMGFQGAEWLERFDREVTEEPDRVVQSLGIIPGETVADVGAGTGYFTFRLARQVGPGGRVLATDIQPEMLERLQARQTELKVTNVVPVLATETETGLPAGEVDWILMVDVYHELAKPARAIDALRQSLRLASDKHKAGRLVLVEYRGEDPAVPIKPLHRTTVQQVRAELEPRGFKLIEVKDFLLHQHVLVFERHEVVAIEPK